MARKNAIRQKRESGVPLGDKSRALNKDCGAGSERCERVLGVSDELAKAGLRAGRAKHVDHGGLARHCIFARLFADQRRIAFEIEKVVGDLEGLADG